jgi:hypothetical protein
MQWVISVLVLVGTFMQFLLALVELRETKRAGAQWSAAEDALVSEQPIWRRRSTRRELRSWRTPEINDAIWHINVALASWLLLVVASGLSLVTSLPPF